MLDYIYALKALISFAFLFLFTRLMGKKQLAQLTYFDYISGITIGNFAASMVVEPEINTIDGLIAILVWGILPILLSMLSRKSRTMRLLFESTPTVIIENGRFRGDGLVKENLTAHNVMLMLRKGGYYKLADIELALMEASGDLSVIQKKQASGATFGDLFVKEPPQGEPRVLIIDGVILHHVLQELELTKEWLLAEIRKKGARDERDVLLAQLQPAGSLYTDIWKGKLEDAL